MFKKIITGKWNQALICARCKDGFYRSFKIPNDAEESAKNPLICKKCGGVLWMRQIGRKIITYNDWLLFKTNRKTYWESQDYVQNVL